MITYWKSVTFGVVIAVISLWFFWAFKSVQIAHWSLNHIFVPTQAGTWGDSFGPLNALFAGLAFVGVIGTVLLQRATIENQRKEQHKSQFDVTFFHLIRLLRETRDEISFTHSNEYRENRSYRTRGTGINAFKYATLELLHWVKNAKSEKVSRLSVSKIYERRIHRRAESLFAPYFRTVYTILRRIKEDAVLTEDEKIQYANLLRAQMTSFETTLCAINALSPIAADFYDLIVHFKLLKYIPDGRRLKFLEHYYPPEAFSGRD